MIYRLLFIVGTIAYLITGMFLYPILHEVFGWATIPLAILIYVIAEVMFELATGFKLMVSGRKRRRT
jgi:uncharacterized membrane protein YuzA (DUF378 family)